MSWIKIRYLQYNNFDNMFKNEYKLNYFFRNSKIFKIENEIINNNSVIIYLNLNYINIEFLIKKPLADLFKYILRDLKFNKHYFEKNIKSKVNKNIIIKTINNDNIILNNTLIDISKKKIIKPNYNFCFLTNYFIYNCRDINNCIEELLICYSNLVIISSYRINLKNIKNIVYDNNFLNNIKKYANYNFLYINMVDELINYRYIDEVKKIGAKKIF